MGRDFDEGIRLFNTMNYFEAHEALETLWLKAHGDDKIFLHGLIQIAAAFHHHTHGNPIGFCSLLEKGWRKLEKFGEARGGIDLGSLRKQLAPWREFERQGKSSATVGPPPFPQIQATKDQDTG